MMNRAELETKIEEMEKELLPKEKVSTVDIKHFICFLIRKLWFKEPRHKKFPI